MKKSASGRPEKVQNIISDNIYLFLNRYFGKLLLDKAAFRSWMAANFESVFSSDPPLYVVLFSFNLSRKVPNHLSIGNVGVP